MRTFLPKMATLAGILVLAACSDRAPLTGPDPEAALPSTATTAAAIIDLKALTDSIKSKMPGRESEGYKHPTEQERLAFLAAVDLALAGDIGGADAAVDLYGYDCYTFTEAVTGDPLVIFRERAPVNRGWGTYVYNRNAQRPVDVHINHPIFDSNTHVQGASLFRDLRGRWMLMAGTHRYANADTSSDMAHNPESLFQKLHEKVIGTGRMALSVHGFNQASHVEPIASSALVLSNGKTTLGATQGTEFAIDLRDRLDRASWKTGLYAYDASYDKLAASRNPQGRYSNDIHGHGRWVHVENDYTVRSDSAKWKQVNAVIVRWAADRLSMESTNPAPLAAFGSVCADLSCQFADGSTDGTSGSVQGWTWDFGDGSASSLQHPSRVYAGAGTYTVILRATDNQGARASVAQNVTVSAPPANASPTAKFAYTCTDLTCTFNDQSTDSDGTVGAWSWNFGDGTTSTTRNPSRTYANSGTYTVSLTVTDDKGATGSTTQSVSVAAPSGIKLSARGWTRKGTRYVDLTWSGATTGSVDIYRKGALLTTTANDGAHTDKVPSGGSYTYKVCNTGTSPVCSNEVTVTL